MVADTADRYTFGPDSWESYWKGNAGECLIWVKNRLMSLLEDDNWKSLHIWIEEVRLIEIDWVRWIHFSWTWEFIPFIDMNFISEPNTIWSQTVIRVEIDNKYWRRGGTNFITITNPSYR